MVTDLEDASGPAARSWPAGTAAVLVLVNAIPLAGVVWAGWDVFRVLALFWAENLVIGAVAVGRLMLIGRRLAMPAFFLVHFGGFCVGHGVLLVHLFGPDDATALRHPIAALFAVLAEPGPALAVGALLASHAWSFAANTLWRREYVALTTRTAMQLPYQRILITQTALILGAGLVGRTGEPLLGLVALVLVKTAFDLRAHLREHEALGGQRAPRGL